MTATNVLSSASLSVFGQAVTFSATVTSASGSGSPTGTVQFVLDGKNLGRPVSLSEGVATSNVARALSVSNHVIQAIYSGDATFATSRGESQQKVLKASTRAIATVGNPSVYGQPVLLMATVVVVSPGSDVVPTGMVIFQDGGMILGIGQLDARGIAVFKTSTLSAGPHAVIAIYEGEQNFVPSTSAQVNQTVNHAATTTTLASSSNPATAGQAISFTATVTAAAPGPGTPSGTVTFLDGLRMLGSSILANGLASLYHLGPGRRRHAHSRRHLCWRCELHQQHLELDAVHRRNRYSDP
jgi:hypothetical protein